MLNFLKKLFKNEPEQTATILKVDELKEFFNTKSKSLTEELNVKIKDLKEKVAREVEKTRENLINLKKAELRNPNIPVRARQIMDGNRESYIRAVSKLINEVEIANSYDAIALFCLTFEQTLHQFAQSTAKAYQVLQEFFAHESREVALNIKEIDSLIKELGTLVRANKLDGLRSLKDAIIELQNDREYRITLVKKINELNGEMDKARSLISNLTNIQEELHSSNEYTELLSLEEMRRKLIKNIEDEKAKINHSFSVIGAALKKYSRITLKDSDLLDSYVLDPVPSLMRDEQLVIVGLLEGTAKSIHNASIDLKDKKRERILEELQQLDHAFLSGYRRNLKELVKKIKDLDERIQTNHSKAKLDDLAEKIDSSKQKAAKLDEEITFSDKELHKIDVESKKRNIQEKIHDVFGSEVVIS
ncbi:MAG TPA: hypothetical protein VJH97_06685 [Candidatus Nanoarchaeia archaeon]|nr:hypothetical protein [Candidatus Nanoarchaeia archaeon]